VAEDCGVMFLSTPFALEAVDLLAPLVPAFKIASGDNNYTALLERVAATEKPVLLSTGMTTRDETAASIATLETVWRSRHVDPGLVVLHCVSAYPTPPEQANLRALATLATLGRPVGFSDHTLGIDAAVAAVALGARVIEKHFTVSKTKSAFRDHALSAELDELREMVARIRAVDQMLGDGVKRIMPDEAAVAQAARRSACAVRDLPAGHVLDMQDVVCLRPAGGIAPDRVGVLMGRALVRAVRAGERLAPELVK
jgi:sialic acid synthase SpsE